MKEILLKSEKYMKYKTPIQTRTNACAEKAGYTEYLRSRVSRTDSLERKLFFSICWQL